ncbi:MAG TPA: ADP-ribosylglycohydrolase family protein [Thiobacillaceae bacterium]|nr:ADP-ribosylglycohydrolase family protein [Thiobacillaceae bacterium]
MLGAIIGDIVGSVWEFHRIKTKDFPLFGERNGITDDSILTVAVADALLHDRDPAEAMRDWARKVKPGRHVAGYGKRFINWVAAPTVQPPYGSYGNGGAMRVSPAAFLASSLEDCLDKARRVTEVTHNHPEGMKGALATAHAIWLARQGEPATAIRLVLSETYGYDMRRSVDEIRAVHVYNETAAGCVPEALTCALEAKDFEDAIRNAVSLGGDADTLASIAGGLAEGMFGMPGEILTRGLEYFPVEMCDVIKEMYKSNAAIAGGQDGEMLTPNHNIIHRFSHVSTERSKRSDMPTYPDSNDRDDNEHSIESCIHLLRSIRAAGELPESVIADLLNLYSETINTLKSHHVLRTANNPTGDYAEHLAKTRMGLELEPPNQRGYDAVDACGFRYQIKGRRITPHNPAMQFGVVRNIDGHPFDFLVGVILNEDWSVRRAIKLTRNAFLEFAPFNNHQNGHILVWNDHNFGRLGVEDVTHLFVL